jgi:tryptophan 2,3-dioxygenase
MLSDDEKNIQNNPFLNDEGKKAQLTQHAKTRANFEMIFESDKHAEAVKEGSWRLSHKATLATLFIYLYRDEPAAQLAFKMLSLLTDIDENFTAWRSRHAQMALRMIGTKIGTGGSSGAEYLQKAAASHRIFYDLTRLATFLIPRRQLPALPSKIKEMLAFHYQVAR